MLKAQVLIQIIYRLRLQIKFTKHAQKKNLEKVQFQKDGYKIGMQKIVQKKQKYNGY